VTTKLTVFLGIFNGSRYLDSLKKQLQEQTNSEFNLLVVDNCSSDNSWEKLQSWENEFGPALTLFRNDENLGAGGSLENVISKGLISTPWFAMMHQDDYYKSNHFETLIDEINRADADVVGICTLMASMDNEGEVKPTPPRAAWLIDDNSQINSFLINLRLQAFSFPTAVVRTEDFKNSFAHWHSPSFSDTETTLNLLTKGRLKYIKSETIQYRENPESESHVINSFESTIGASLGLTRVFTSSGFRGLLKQVPTTNRGKFYLGLISGIENRVPQSSLREYVKTLATEECCYAWGYSEFESNQHLAEVYSSLGSNFTSSMLAGRIKIEVPEVNSELEMNLRSLSNRFGIPTFGRTMIAKKSKRIRKLLTKIPLKIRIKLFKVYVHLRSIKQPDYYWNIFWN
jgi:glycosyltransferase involved in cell wall biosynthesis